MDQLNWSYLSGQVIRTQSNEALDRETDRLINSEHFIRIQEQQNVPSVCDHFTMHCSEFNENVHVMMMMI